MYISVCTSCNQWKQLSTVNFLCHFKQHLNHHHSYPVYVLSNSSPPFSLTSSNWTNLLLKCFFFHLPPNLLNPPRSPILMKRKRKTAHIEGWCGQRFLSMGCGQLSFSQSLHHTHPSSIGTSPTEPLVKLVLTLLCLPCWQDTVLKSLSSYVHKQLIFAIFT